MNILNTVYFHFVEDVTITGNSMDQKEVINVKWCIAAMIILVTPQEPTADGHMHY